MVFVVISLFLSILLVGWTWAPLKMNNGETMPTKVFEVSKCQILRCWAGQFLGQELKKYRVKTITFIVIYARPRNGSNAALQSR